MLNVHKKIYQPYAVMLCVYGIFAIAALIIDTPAEIYKGLQNIVTSRSVVLTDYMSVGGIGATLVNSVLVGCIAIFMLVINGVKPNGSIIMALWLTTGFAMFGKNLFNMLPITFGVYLYSRFQKEPFINFTLVALLSATLSPVVSGIAFSDVWELERSIFEYNLIFLINPEARIVYGIIIGVFVGFLFPAVSSFTMRVHGGYNLYNMGFAGGLISTFIVLSLSNLGMQIDSQLECSSGNNLTLSVLLYIIFAGLVAIGLICGGGKKTIEEYPRLLKSTGRLVSDFHVLFGKSVYFNMGVTGALATTFVLLLNCELNGPVLSGIFTIVGYSAFGKHPSNVLPLMIGAVISIKANRWDPTAPLNTLAILFSTGLAPIAGQFGWGWGIAAGILHVNTVMHISFLNSGFNLYNNGYAAGFVAMLLIPLITAFRNEKEDS